MVGGASTAPHLGGVVSGIDAQLMPGYLFGLDDLLGFNAGVFPGVLCCHVDVDQAFLLNQQLVLDRV